MIHSEQAVPVLREYVGNDATERGVPYIPVLSGKLRCRTAYPCIPYFFFFFLETSHSD